MAFLEALGAAGAEGLASMGRPLLTSVVGAGVREGLSANAMIRMMAEQGLGIRRQRFLDIVRAVKATQSAEAMAMGADLNSIPTMGAVPEVEVGNLTGFVHKVKVYQTNIIDGIRTQTVRNIFVRSNDPLMIKDVVNRAMDVYNTIGATSDSPEVSEEPPVAEYAGVVKQVGRRA